MSATRGCGGRRTRGTGCRRRSTSPARRCPRSGPSRFQIERGRFHEERGAAVALADATVTADGNILNEIIWSGRDLDEAVRDGLLRIDGDMAAVRRFLDFFPLPEPAPVPG
ncbi:hypothetical protein ACH35V_16995 [Actinomadura sp. 1N219]|uniref:hypothetical protein n=1 Tax=Actinomadura sp. 1N219 TaxID=3375152 RepID=UPI00379C0CE8